LLGHPPPERAADLCGRACYRRADGSVLAQALFEFHPKDRSTTPWHTDCGYGWLQAGQWPVGAYRVDLVIEEYPIAAGWFEIYE
jgi:hypothetical protein